MRFRDGVKEEVKVAGVRGGEGWMEAYDWLQQPPESTVQRREE